MGDDKNGRDNGMAIDIALVRELAEMLAETGLTEIEVEDNHRKIRVSRAAAPAAAPSHYAAAPPALAAPASAPAALAAPIAPDHANAVKSPMVGTVYLSAEPGSAAFVSVGQTVKDGKPEG